MQRSHVLYVEDNPSDVQLVRTALAEAKVNADLHVVENAVQAFSFLVRQPPFQDAPKASLVIFDLNLPVINGVRAMTIIKSSKELKDTRIAVFTSSNRPEDRAMCKRLGVIAFETKPTTYDGYLELATRMKRQLESIACGDRDPDPEPESDRIKV